MKTLMTSIVAAGLILISTVAPTAQDARTIFSGAVAVWHMADTNDSSGANSFLTAKAPLELGVPLSGPDYEASLVRGGDGKVARLTGGWLDAGQGVGGELNLAGDQFTALIRFRAEAGAVWDTRGLLSKGGGHDRLVFNFFSHDFNEGRERMRLGCEIGVAGGAGLAAQVSTQVERIGATSWHDVIARYDGRELVLFVDGVALDRKPVKGKLRGGNIEPLTIGAGGAHDNPFPCLIDHAAIWNRALSDAEVVALSGGSQKVAESKAAFERYTLPPQRPPLRQLVEHFRELRDKFMADPHRPRYHLLHPEEGRIMPGDPNGAIWWKGRYHLFYIFQRFQEAEPRTVHCWGHVSSTDLVHWEHHPTALDVAPNDPDRGIYSGNAFVTKEGVPMILYHGVDAGNSIALAQDDLLLSWKKSPANPIVRMPKKGEADYGKYDSWDPHGWIEAGNYYAIFGGNPHTGAKAALFKGESMTQLKFQGEFMTKDPWSQPGEDVSCPDFFTLGGRHVLMCISHMRGARYYVGRWENERFVPELHARMNWPGGQFFAPETLLDHKGRRILWAWCLDERPTSAQAASGWSGVMSLPRVLGIGADGLMTIEPVPELQKLRHNPRQPRRLTIGADAEVRLDDIQGDGLEIKLEMQSSAAQEFGLKLRQTPDGAEETAIVYDPRQGLLKIDLSKSTLDPTIRYRTWCITRPDDPEDRDRRVTSQDAPLRLAPGEPLRLQIFLDRSMLEVFANGRQCVTQRLWPTRRDALGVSLFSRGGETRVESLEAWDMSPAQPY